MTCKNCTDEYYAPALFRGTDQVPRTSLCRGSFQPTKRSQAGAGSQRTPVPHPYLLTPAPLA